MRLIIALVFSGVLFSAEVGAKPASLCGQLSQLLTQHLLESTRPHWPLIPIVFPVPLKDLPTQQRRLRIQTIVEAAFDGQGPLVRRVREETLKQGSNGLLRAYFETYSLLFYSEGYQGVVEKANQFLPQEGLILDIGSGPAIFASSLLELARDRRFILVDHEEALGIARRNLAFASSEAETDRHIFVGKYLRRRNQVGAPTANAAVMNHVLYLLPRANQQTVLQTVYEQLGSGGILVINEPVFPRAASENLRKEWFIQRVSEAFENGAPHTEEDLGFLAAFVFGRATAMFPEQPFSEPAILSQDGLIQFVRSMGFQWQAQEVTYDGYSSFLVFRRP